MKNRLSAALLIACVGGVAHSSDPIVLDGRFDDWGGIPFEHVDAPDDATGAFDVCRVSAVARGTEVFLRFNTGRVITIQSGPKEEGTLTVEFETDAGRRLTADLRGRSLWLDGDPEHKIGHAEVRLQTAPTHSSEQFEMRVDLAALGAVSGDGVTIRFGGSDEVEAPIRVVLNDDVISRGNGSVERAPGTMVRVASQNVWHNGLTKPERREAIGRLLRAVDADVYCIQEEWRTPAEEVGAAFDAATGSAPGTWHAANTGGAAVVSRHPIEFPQTGLGRGTIGIVTMATGERIAVTSVHFKCCGYDGSMEDRARVEEVRGVMDALRGLSERYDGAVVAGDWNLVGSALPVTVATAEGGIGLERVMPMHLDGVECYTWRDEKQGFTPGMLDVVARSRDIRVLRSFVLDTADLTEEQLRERGLERGDSSASDHLMVVTDCAIGD